MTLLLLGSYVAELPGQASFRARAPLAPPPPAILVVRLGSWTGENASVVATCSGCGTNVSGGSALTVTLRVQPACGSFGCSPDVRAVDATAPFVAQNVTPSLPSALSASGSNLTVSILVPTSGGPYRLNGTVRASGVPGPVVVTDQSWTPRNSSGGDSGLVASPRTPNPTVAGGTLFNVSVFVNNTSPDYLVVTNLTVTTPFALIAAGPGYPYALDVGWTGTLFAELRAPTTPGNYSLTGTVAVGPLPQDVIASVNVTFVGVPSNLTVTSVDIGRIQLPGEEFNGSLVIANPSGTAHQLGFNRTIGPWFFVNGTPSGRFTIGANGSIRFYLSISAKNAPGTYPLGLVFNVYTEPAPKRGPGRFTGARPARPGHAAPGPSQARRSLAPSPGPSPPRRPG